MNRFLVACLMSGGALAPLAAQAQSPSTSVSEVQEVVVTAQKRETKLENTAMTINVVTGAQLEKQGVKEIKDLKASVPGLTLDESPGGLSAVSLRGVGTSASNQLFEQSVGLFIDGVYHPRARQFRDGLFDIERLEVIKGSQGVLFGKNTSVGAISVISHAPGGQFGGYLKGEYETEYGSRTLEGAVDLPASDTFKVRLSGLYDDQHGYVRNISKNRDEGGNRRYVARTVMSWDVSPQVNVLLKLQYSDLKTVGNSFQFVIPGPAAPIITAGVLDGGRVPYQKYEASPGTPDTIETQKAYDPALIVTYDLPNGFSLTSTTGLTGYKFQNGFDSDSTPAPLLLSQFNETFRQASQELRLASPTGGAIDYIVGVFAMSSKDNYDYKSYYSGFPVAGGLYGLVSQKLDQTEKDYAVFGQATWHISDRVKLDFGGRLNTDKKKGTYRKAYLDNLGHPGNVLATLVPGSTLSGMIDDTTIDASATLSYAMTPRSTFYASVGRGNKGGSFLNTAATAALYPAPFILPKEVATTYEVGIKGRFLAGRAYASLAAYHLDITDFQDSFYNPIVRAFQARSVDAKTTGVEGEGTFQATRWLNLYGNFAWNPTAKLANGERMQRAPKLTSTVGVRVTHDLTPDAGFSANAELLHSDSIFHQPVSATGDNTSGIYDLVNLRAQFTYKPAQLDFYVNASNVTKQRYRTFVFGSPLGLGQMGAFNAPRMITLGVRKGF